MIILLSTNKDIDNKKLEKHYKSVVVNNSKSYIESLISDLTSIQTNCFNVLEAEIILNDLLIDFDETNPFLKKYFIIKEYSTVNSDKWYDLQGNFIPDLYEELESHFSLDDKQYDFLTDEYEICYKFKTTDFLFFLNEINFNYEHVDLKIIHNSSELLIF
jgi:hypothetical protein